MPPLIAVALGVIGAAFLGRWLYREGLRVNAELHPPRASSFADIDPIPLQRDPSTGVYQPK